MNFLFKLFSVFFVFLYSFSFSGDAIKWKEIEEGCFYSRVTIQKENENIDTVNILKIDPEKFFFKVFYERKEKGWPKMHNIKEWHEKNPNAKIFINGSYYDENRRPTTAIWQEGVCINKKKGILKKGALFLQPEDMGKINLINLKENPVEIIKDKFYYAIQSMPVIISDGYITVNKSDWRANRTIIAKDMDENILIVVTEGSPKYKSFSLYEMAEWLLKSDFNLVLAVNMDGGYESQLSINTDKLKYSTIGQWETNDTSDISKPGLKIKIPVAIGFFKK